MQLSTIQHPAPTYTRSPAETRSGSNTYGPIDIGSSPVHVSSITSCVIPPRAITATKSTLIQGPDYRSDPPIITQNNIHLSPTYKRTTYTASNDSVTPRFLNLQQPGPADPLRYRPTNTRTMQSIKKTSQEKQKQKRTP